MFAKVDSYNLQAVLAAIGAAVIASAPTHLPCYRGRDTETNRASMLAAQGEGYLARCLARSKAAQGERHPEHGRGSCLATAPSRRRQRSENTDLRGTVLEPLLAAGDLDFCCSCKLNKSACRGREQVSNPGSHLEGGGL